MTNKQWLKIDGFEQKSAKHTRRIKKQTEKGGTPTRDRRRARTRSRTYERQKRAPSGNARTIVRREHQAHCAHPAVGITSTEPGGLARPRKTKLNEYKPKRFGKGYGIFAYFAYGLRSLWSRSSHAALPEFLQALPGSWSSTEESQLSVSCV